jgi:hypothetical protein
MAGSLAVNSYSMVSAVQLFMGSGDTARNDALAMVNQGYREFLAGEDPLTGVLHTWSFLTPWASLSVGGAVETTNASQGSDGVTVTAATSDTFDPSMVGLLMTVKDYDGAGSSIETTIVGYTSATVVTIDDDTEWTNGSCDLEIEATGIYDLPTDFAGLDVPFMHHYSASDATPDMIETSPEDIMARWRDNSDTGDPAYFAVISESFGTSQDYQVWIAPRPDTSRNLWYRYLVEADALTDSTTDFHMGDPAHGDTIRALALAAAEMETSRVAGAERAAADRAMHRSVALDRVRHMTGRQASLSQG